MRLQPLGDQAVLAYCDDELAATRLARRVRHGAPSWCVDIVQAYVSVAMYYDASSDYFQASRWLRESLPTETETAEDPARIHVIPCCYEMALDLDKIAFHT